MAWVVVAAISCGRSRSGPDSTSASSPSLLLPPCPQPLTHSSPAQIRFAMSADASSAPVGDVSAPASILKKSKSSSSSLEPTKTPSTSQQAEAARLEASLPAPPKKERKPKRPRGADDPTKPASTKRAKKAEVPELPYVEGKKAEKKRVRAEAQAARPKEPEPEAAEVKQVVGWNEDKNGQNPYEDESLSDAAKKGQYGATAG